MEQKEGGTKKKHLVWIVVGIAAVVGLIIFLTTGLPSGHASGLTLADNVSILQGQVANHQGSLSALQLKVALQAENISNLQSSLAGLFIPPDWTPAFTNLTSQFDLLSTTVSNWSLTRYVEIVGVNTTYLVAKIHGFGDFVAFFTAYGPNWTAPVATPVGNYTVADTYLPNSNMFIICVNPFTAWADGDTIEIEVEDLTGSISYVSASTGAGA